MKDHHRRLNIRLGINGKVVIAMFVVVLSTMLMSGFYSYSMSKKILIDQVEKEVATKADNVSTTVSSVFEQKGEIVRQLSSIPVVESFMSVNESRGNVRSNKDFEWIQRALNTAKEKNKNVNLVWLANTERSYFIAGHDYVSNANYNIQHRSWYKKASESNGLSYSTPYIDYVTKKLTISITHPVTIDNNRLGYLGVDIHLNNLAELLMPFETSGQKLLLISDQGNVLYGSEKIWTALQDVQKKELREVQKLNIDKKTHYIAISEMEELGWKIGVYMPEKVILEPLFTYEKSLSISWLIVVILLLTSLAFVLQYFLKDIPLILRQINKIKHGDLNVKIGIKRKDEIGEISRAVEQMGERIKNQMDEMDYQARHDSLTSLANRNSIDRTLQKWIEEIDITSENMVVVFLDLDHFKQVNDSKGHAHGDELLIEVGKRINELLPMNSFFGRFGGDEFVLIIRHRKEALHQIHSCLQMISESIANPFLIFGQNIYITASIGVSVYPTDAQTKDELLINADTALYHAKEKGRNCIYFFNNEMKERVEMELKLKDGLRKALLNEEFFLHYQPQLDVRSGKTLSVEALIRWKHPEIGMVSPAEFIPLSERTGQIGAIGDWVIDASLKMVKRISMENLNIEHVAINVSAIQLREVNFVEKLQKKLAYYDVHPSLLEIEITESVIIDHQEEIIQKLVELKNLGIKIALDDFGTGYSSLNYLRLMPIDRVKVDRSFIQKVEEDNVVKAILNTIITLGHSLGFQLVAEGVEEETQLKILCDMNVDSIQGYYYSRPLDEEALLEFLKKSMKSEMSEE